MSVPNRSNEAWLSALRARDQDVVRQLHAYLLAGLRRSLRARMGDQVDDMAQEAVLRVLDSLSSFRGDSRLTTWAMAIATRLALTELRKAHWKDRPLDEVVQGADEPDPARGVARERVLGALADAMDRTLTQRQRTVMIAELRGVPQCVLCERLAISRNALYKLTFDARRALERGLGQAGIEREEVLWALDAEKG